ncbi:MAG TPA: RidA family protein [Thermoanaerobaculia bacterium]|jgi:enamine deaminase RidA (YjgF/YER057c/UK114 family)|nr:RidA family protein [Thermoanaerobaculia bacterium]
MSDALQAIDPPELGSPQGYANGIVVPAGRRLLFVAGQIGWDAEQRLVGDGFVEQFAQALANVLVVVRAAGGEAADLTRLTVYVVDKAEYAAARRELGASWRELMGRHYPAMALVEVRGLLAPGAKVEIEATAALP